HPAPHALPTRRSSDLTTAFSLLPFFCFHPQNLSLIERKPSPKHQLQQKHQHLTSGFAPLTTLFLVIVPSFPPLSSRVLSGKSFRSEEHTSELESRENI